MFNTDKPIKEISEDKLSRAEFAKQLADSIMSFETTDNYAISLQGRWGSGKTSVINMILNEIEYLSNQRELEKKIVTVKFNPWNFTDNTNLITQFFLSLNSTLKLDKRDKIQKKLGEEIEKYASVLVYTGYIPVVGKYLKIVPNMAKSFGKGLKDNADKREKDISYRKKQVEDALGKLDFRILIVIDDIDRLPNEQIQLIFQLVNNLAGFSNVIYLLSYDKNIVERALSDVQHCDGGEYLEKIIQIPFDLPEIDDQNLEEILSEKIQELMGSSLENLNTMSRWYNVSRACIYPFIRTLRDVNRFMNVLEFKYFAVKDEVNFIDLLGITGLQVFAISIFEWIKENKFSLIGGYSKMYSSVPRNKNDKEKFLKEFEGVYDKSPEIMLNAVSSLFPKFSNNLEFDLSFPSSEELNQEMRISSDKFDLYFSLNLRKIKISRKELDESLLDMDEIQLRLYVKYIYETNLMSNYLYEIRNNLSRIPKERIELLLSTLLFESGRIKNEENSKLVFRSYSISIYDIKDILFAVDDEEERFKIIKNIFCYCDSNGFQYIYEILQLIELTYGKIERTDYVNEKKLINEMHLKELEQIFITRIKSISSVENLLEWEKTTKIVVFSIWELIDKNSFGEYLKSLLVTDKNIIIYISLFARLWTSSDNQNNVSHSYDFVDYSYRSYIGDEMILKSIERFRKLKEFWKLEDEIIDSIVAYVIWSEREEKNNQIQKLEIDERKKIWLNENVGI